MKAAVVTAYGQAPQYADVPEPQATGEHHLVVDVLASGLHPRVRMQADGSHYTASAEDLPLVPGIDGVGRDPDGRLWLFFALVGRHGSMSEKAVIDTRHSLLLPEGTDPVAMAGTMNCAIAPWLALKRRFTLEKGQAVLILGATGSTGRMSVPVARHLGAARITAVARDAAALAAIPDVDVTAPLNDPQAIAQAGAEVDVVLDYLWGTPSAAAMSALVAARPDPVKPLTWIQLGQMAGAEAPVPAAVLRSSRLQIIGSGQGALSAADMSAEMPSVAAEISRGTFVVHTTAAPLQDVEQIWSRPNDSSTRIVFIPTP